jgi:hypothetical protein
MQHYAAHEIFLLPVQQDLEAPPSAASKPVIQEKLAGGEGTAKFPLH